MIFTTPIFALFFAIVLAFYFACPRRMFRQTVLLVASMIFYGWWDWRFLALVWTLILIAYHTAIAFEAHPRKKKTILAIGIMCSLIILGFFKYCNFFILSFKAIAATIGFHPDITTLYIILPVGISFHVFQVISYLLDAYRGDIPVEKSLFRVGLFIAFFPQLVAGPIVRAADFLPQLDQDVRLDQLRMVRGLRSFTVGFIYKAVFADCLAAFADPIFRDVAIFDNRSLVAASVAYYAQIYFDFAGYSLMAIAVADMLGYDFPVNFNFPYGAASISDFWRRWHISLSSWLRDYLYIPLGGNREGKLMQYRNLMITMLLGGLWHGASWNFVIWGGLHGAALIVNKTLIRIRNSVASFSWLELCGGWLLTQTFVLLCWIPFRVPDLPTTLQVLQAFAGTRHDAGLAHAAIDWWLILFPISADLLIGRFASPFAMSPPTESPQRLKPIMQCILLGIIFSIVLMLVSLDVKPFVYFQF